MWSWLHLKPPVSNFLEITTAQERLKAQAQSVTLDNFKYKQKAESMEKTSVLDSVVQQTMFARDMASLILLVIK